MHFGRLVYNWSLLGFNFVTGVFFTSDIDFIKVSFDLVLQRPFHWSSECSAESCFLYHVCRLCGLLQFSDEVRKKSLSQLMLFLCHAYPIVRKNTANKLYESIVTYDSVVDDGVLDEVTVLLMETLW